MVTGRCVPSSMETIECTGRMYECSPPPQRIIFGQRSDSMNCGTRCCSVACAASCIQAGISSSSSSKKYSAIRRLQQREPQFLTPLEVLLRAPHRQLADALDHADALGHRHGAARVEDVEHVRALQRP